MNYINGIKMASKNESDRLLLPRRHNKRSSLSICKDQISHAAFQTLLEELPKTSSIPLLRSESEPVISASQIVQKQGRRALYGALPFVAAFGMHKREKTLSRVLSVASCNALESILPDDIDVFKQHLLEEVDVDEIVVTWPLVMAVLVAIVAQFLIGFNTAVMNAPEKSVFPRHSEWSWSLAVSSLAIGGIVGSTLGTLADRFGRRRAILINTWTFTAGGILMTIAPNMYVLIIARFIVGLASGLGSVLVPIYLGEVAPPTLRGTLGTLNQFAMVIGLLMSGILSVFWGTPTTWRYLFSVTPALCILQLLASPFLLESPRYLLSCDEESLEARKVIKRLRGFRHDEDVEQEVQHFLFASTKHTEAHAPSNAVKQSAMMSLLCNRPLRPLLVACFVLQASQQLCGINAVFYYSTSIFAKAIKDPVWGTIIVAAVNVLATYIALKLMDTTERRTLLLWSSGGMTVSIVFIIVALCGLIYKQVALFAVMAFVAFFEIGLGPIPWLIVAEMFESRYVATAMSFSCIVNWSCTAIVGFFFPLLQEWLGPLSFAPFLVVTAMAYCFAWVWLPETHGRSVEDIQKLVQQLPKPRTYSSLGSGYGGFLDQDADAADDMKTPCIPHLIIHPVESYGL